jgi:hypothetical protein
MCCVSVQVGEGKYGDVNCYGHALDGHGVVIKLVPESNVKAVRRLEREAGMLLRAQPAVGRTLPRPLHWAVDKRVCCSRPVRMCLRVHRPLPALACHRHAAARRQRVVMLAVLCSLQHCSRIVGTVFVCGRPYACAHVSKASLPHVPHARANEWGLPVLCLYRQCMSGLLQ